MDYSKLVAVTGLPGLYELVNSKTDGAIIRSLEDNSTKFASSRIHNFSHLESIEVYTIRENVNLVEIFQAMEKAGGSLPDGKDNALLKKYFENTYPDLDFERVYASDLKKMVKWFDILKKKNIEIKLSEPPAETKEEETQVEIKEPGTKKVKPAPTVKEEKTAKKAVKKDEAAARPETTDKVKSQTTGKKKVAVQDETKKEAAPGKVKKEENPGKKSTPKKK